MFLIKNEQLKLINTGDGHMEVFIDIFRKCIIVMRKVNDILFIHFIVIQIVSLHFITNIIQIRYTYFNINTNKYEALLYVGLFSVNT